MPAPRPDALEHLRHGVEDNGRYTFRLITIFSLVVQVWVVLTGWRQGPQWLRMALPFMLLLVPFLGLPEWEGPWGFWRAILPITIAFCFLVPADRRFVPVVAGRFTAESARVLPPGLLKGCPAGPPSSHLGVQDAPA